MISKRFSIFWCLMIVQCGLVLSVDEQGLRDSKQNTEISSISLSHLLDTFRHLHHDTVDGHLSLMCFTASYGDHLYNLPADVSAKCFRTARANSLLLGKLAICAEAFDVMFAAVDEVTRDLQKRTELKEHPLELLCARLERRYANETTLSGLFEKAKVEAANFDFTSHRPPYLGELIKGKEFFLKMVEKSDIPEMAKLLAYLAVRNVLRGGSRGKFIKSCGEVAKREKFADSMQKIYEKAISDVLPEIMANDRVEKFKSEKRDAGMWWVTNFVKNFPNYLEDPILKKEVEDLAAISSTRHRY